MKSILVFLVFCTLVAPKWQAQNEDSNTMKETFVIYQFPIKQNFIAISPLPDKNTANQAIRIIKEQGITQVISLIQTREIQDESDSSFFNQLESNQIKIHHFPIEDFGVPRQEQMDSIYNLLSSFIENHENILIHCKGGFGRSGTVIAAFVKHYLNEPRPIEYVREIRGKEAIENVLQEKFVLDYFRNP